MSEGCGKVCAAGGLCVSHGGGTKCKTEGCIKKDQGGGHCKAHGGGYKCRSQDCNKQAQVGGHCAAHGGGRRCRTEGCLKYDAGGGRCRAHGGGNAERNSARVSAVHISRINEVATAIHVSGPTINGLVRVATGVDASLEAPLPPSQPDISSVEESSDQIVNSAGSVQSFPVMRTEVTAYGDGLTAPEAATSDSEDEEIALAGNGAGA